MWLATTNFMVLPWLCGYMASSQRLCVSVSISPEFVDEIDEHAGEMNRSAYIRQAVREYIDDNNDDE